MSLARREADIALRLGRPKDRSLTGGDLRACIMAFMPPPAGHGGSVPFIANDVDAARVVEPRGRRLEVRASSLPVQQHRGASGGCARAFGLSCSSLMGDADKALTEVWPMDRILLANFGS